MICRNFARASAPAKVILFGEHFVVYGGPAILGSIDKRIRVSARPIASTKIKINSDIGYFASYPSDRLIESRPHFTEAERILYPLYTATHKVLKDHLIGTAKSIGVEIQLSTDIPLGAGLGSSASIVRCYRGGCWISFSSAGQRLGVFNGTPCREDYS